MPRRLLILSALAAIAAVAPASAHAACVSSTPATTSVTDPTGDAGVAPDLGTATLSLDAACTVRFDPGVVASTFGADDEVLVYVDTDGGRSTGEPDVGTDVVIATFGTATGVEPTVMAKWTGGSYDVENTVILPSPTLGGFSATIDELGIPVGATIRLIAATVDGTDTAAEDYVPDGSDAMIDLRVAYTQTPPPPPPPPTSSAPAPPPSAPVLLPQASPAQTPRVGCTVPSVRTLSLTRAKTKLSGAGCTVAAKVRRVHHPRVPKGRVIGTTPAAGKRATGPVTALVSKGPKPRRRR